LRRVLVLEDDECLREMLVDTVESLDFEVHGADGAKMALVLGRQFEFDVIISDIRMAGPTDGLGVLAQLKQQQPKVACIVITGFADQTAPLRALQIRVDDYLYKPFEVNHLVEALERVRQSRQQNKWYRQFLSKLFATQASPEQLDQLQQARESCLKFFFVGIRSKHLYAETALAAWDHWEELEADYLRVAGVAQAPLELVRSLLERYQIWQDKVTRDARERSFVSASQRSQEKVERATFRRFFERVQSAQLSAEDISLAVSLRRIPAERRRCNPELERLYRRTWG
jgi:YesN/AraC family two-component response regulator